MSTHAFHQHRKQNHSIAWSESCSLFRIHVPHRQMIWRSMNAERCCLCTMFCISLFVAFFSLSLFVFIYILLLYNIFFLLFFERKARLVYVCECVFVYQLFWRWLMAVLCVYVVDIVVLFHFYKELRTTILWLLLFLFLLLSLLWLFYTRESGKQRENCSVKYIVHIYGNTAHVRVSFSCLFIYSRHSISVTLTADLWRFL